MKSFAIATLGFIVVSAIQLDQEVPNVLAQVTQDGDDCIPCTADSAFLLEWSGGWTGGCIATRSDISCCPDQCDEQEP